MAAETPNFDDLFEADIKEYIRKENPGMAETAVQAVWIEFKAKMDEITAQFKNQEN